MISNQRIQSLTPPFFSKLFNETLTISAVVTTIISTSAILPAVLVKIPGYMTLSGIAASVFRLMYLVWGCQGRGKLYQPIAAGIPWTDRRIDCYQKNG